ncbi:response regulator transcription factor [Agaribacterium haliotis]|uniref:response regulator transcription factor n=1 Tax=Agaribacterium haliotis TaxID=2013869 RepID=UPI000BB57AC1|nr:response regulator transcription factor [Agaribacterium haliotis]
MSTSSILLVEDDLKLATLTANFLRQHGYEVQVAGSCADALRCLSAAVPALILLDLGLPDGDGLELCADLRRHYSGPLLMLTARDSSAEQIDGLDAGADDFICKPVEPMVLLARVRAFLRRHRPASSAASQALEIKSLKIVPRSQQVWLEGREIKLSNLEFSLLSLLAERADNIVSRDELYREVKGVEYDGLDRSVDIQISRLRKKLETKNSNANEAEHGTRIRTVRSKGYLLVSEAW